jgi:hypothetical protein
MNNLNPLTVVLYLLAVARLTHLVVEDDLTGGFRGKVLERVSRAYLTPAIPPGPSARWWGLLNSVVTCPWCASPYVAALVMGALALGLPDWCLAIPAAAYVTGWLEMALGAMDDE